MTPDFMMREAMTTIDLNCDMGESFGAWTMGQDDAVLAHVTSANIACGFHAGDPLTMRRTVAAAVKHGVAILSLIHKSEPTRRSYNTYAVVCL
jgi:lactam utilization protein B